MEEIIIETNAPVDSEDVQPITINIENKTESEEMTLVSVDTDRTTISASDANGFKSVILAMIGDYDVITKDYTYQSNTGQTQHNITHQEDYPWMISAAIFIIVVYCFLRMLGGAIFGKR